MSLRWMGRVVYQIGTKVVQASRDQAAAASSKYDSAFKSAKESSKQAASRRSYTPAARSASKNELQLAKLRQSEEALRTVMFLSCWGPN